MVGDVKARIVRSDGQEMTIGDGEWRIPNDGLENWANLPYSVSSVELPSHDGAIVTSKRVGSIDRTITAVARGREPEKLREKAIRFFNPKHTFDVHMTYMGRTFWCRGEQIGFKASEGNIYQPPRITWSILCPNPYLLSEDDFNRDIAETVGKFGFPFMSFLPESAGSLPGANVGFIASRYVFNKRLTVTNDGDVPCGTKIRMRASGYVLNPVISVGDTFVRLVRIFEKDNELVIDATVKPPRVTVDGKNAMRWLDRKSNLLGMVLEVGDTEVAYDAEVGDQNMSVVVTFNKQYLGV